MGGTKPALPGLQEIRLERFPELNHDGGILMSRGPFEDQTLHSPRGDERLNLIVGVPKIECLDRVEEIRLAAEGPSGELPQFPFSENGNH